MDFNDPEALKVFFDVHRDLPREGPGNTDSARAALSLATSLPASPRVLDVACGPGAGTLDLATLLPRATIEAVDMHEPFVDQARQRLAAAGFDERVRVSIGDMRSLPFEPASFDLVWCEGAVDIVGLTSALESWLPLLRPGGAVAFTEVIWLRPDPPDALRAWWDANANQPAMGDAHACETLVQRAGYRVLGTFVLPEAAWWDDYYRPMAQRIEVLSSKYAADERALGVVHEAQEEIDWYRAYSSYYGYLFVVATPR